MKKPKITKTSKPAIVAPKVKNYSASRPLPRPNEHDYKIKELVTYTATSEEHGIQAHASTEKKAIKLLEQEIAKKLATK